MIQFTHKPLATLKITSPYGERTLKGKQDFHKGIDYAANSSTKVYAAHDGTIIRGSNESAGNYVIICSKDGWETHYYHLSSIKVKAGAKVKGGSVIGIAGSTGYATGPHLHFGLYLKRSTLGNSSVDPQPYIDAMLPANVKLKQCSIKGQLYEVPMTMIDEENYIRFKDLETVGLGKVGYDSTKKIPTLS